MEILFSLEGINIESRDRWNASYMMANSGDCLLHFGAKHNPYPPRKVSELRFLASPVTTPASNDTSQLHVCLTAPATVLDLPIAFQSGQMLIKMRPKIGAVYNPISHTG
jgi:hypothetical protein